MAGTGGWVRFPKAVLTDVRLSPWARLAYAYLVGGQYGDESKSVTATRAQIADAIGCSQPHVARALSELKKAGLIANLNAGRTSKRPAKWKINKPSYASPVIQGTPPDISPAVNLRITGDTRPPDQRITGDTPLKNCFKNINKAPLEDDLLSEAVRIFNARAQTMGLPRVWRLTGTHRTQLNARLNDLGGIEGWNALLDRVAQCPSLLGEGGEGWTADFDFLIREASCTKIMEGSYADTPRSSETTQQAIATPPAALVDDVATQLRTPETPAETEARSGVTKPSPEIATRALGDMRAILAPGKRLHEDGTKEGSWP